MTIKNETPPLDAAGLGKLSFPSGNGPRDSTGRARSKPVPTSLSRSKFTPSSRPI
jgi:hypothetical protein